MIEIANHFCAVEDTARFTKYMPVAKGGPSPARQAIIIGLGALFGVLAIVFLVTRLDRLSGDGEDSFQVGNPIFTVGQADDLSVAIAEQGPLLLQDPSGGDLDVWVQHLGPSPERDWVAFAVRPEGAPRDCFANWNPEDENFVDTCDDTIYNADGEGLQQYSVSVNNDGALTLNLNADE